MVIGDGVVCITLYEAFIYCEHEYIISKYFVIENILFSYSEVFFTPLFWETPNFIFINGGAPIFRTMYVGRKNE